MSFPQTDVAQKAFGSVDRDDGALEYASRDTWPRELVEVVDSLERLYHVDRYSPSSLRKPSDEDRPSVVYRCHVQERTGFGTGAGTGWGLPEESAPVCK